VIKIDTDKKVNIFVIWLCYIICVIGVIININIGKSPILFINSVIVILIFTVIVILVTIIMLINNKKKNNKKQDNPLLKIYLDGKLKYFTHNQEYASYRFNELYNFYYDINKLENHSIELKIQK